MTHGASIDVREVIFINGDAEKAYQALPAAVIELSDGAITALQNDHTPPQKGRWKALRGKLDGIGEIRISVGSNTFRVYVFSVAFPPSMFSTRV